MRRLARAVVKLWWPGLLLVGLPIGLVRLSRPMLPAHLPSGPQVIDWILNPWTRSTVIDGALLAGWLGWVLLVYAALVEIHRHVARLRRRLPHLQVPGPLQSLSAAVLGTVAASSPAAAASAAPPVTASVATYTPPTRATPAHPPVEAAPATTHPAGGSHTVRTARLAAATSQLTLVVAGHPHTYTVHRGDNLSHIARDWLGDPHRWPQIYHLNHGRHFPSVGGTLSNPNLIYPGWTLILPDDARPPAQTPNAAAPSTPGGGPSDSDHSPGTTPPSTPTTPPSQPATPSPTPGGSPAFSTPPGPGAALASPSPSASTSASASTSDTGAASSTAPAPSRTSPPGPTPQAAPPRHRSIGVDLPGGWLPIPLAAALITAATLVWLRRRHRYLPGPPTGPVLSDPDLQPLPPALTLLRRGVRRHAPHLLASPAQSSPSTTADTTTHDTTTQGPGTPHVGHAAAPPATPPPPIGPSATGLAGLGTPIPAGGLGLCGDGAPAAARALLVATLTAASPHDPDTHAQVLIPLDTLSTLLGLDAAHLDDTPRLTVTANLSEALTRLEELLIQRRRQLHDEDTDADHLASPCAAHPPMPPVLLLAQVPPTHAWARLTTTLHLGAPLQINAALLGEWRHGDTIVVEANGHTTAQDGERLGVLDTATTLQLLHLLREAHTGQRPAPPTPEQLTPTTAENTPPPDTAPGDDQRDEHPPVHDQPRPASPAPQAPDPPATSPQPQPAPDHEPQPLGPAPSAAPPPGTPTRRRVPIQVLGPPAIIRDGVMVDGLRTRAQELMVYLAIHRTGANLSDIKEAFWPDATNSRAGERLQTEVGNLRRHLRITAGNKKIQPVVNTGSRYHLNPDILDVDWWSVQDALAAATTATTTQQRIAHLSRAVAAHHGPLAQGCTYDWLTNAEEHARRQGIIAHTQLADLIADTDAPQAADLLEDATALDPYNEDLARRAMRAHARLGNAQAIRAQQQRIRAALHEIDLEPDEHTTQLATELLRQITDNRPPDRPPQPPDS